MCCVNECFLESSGEPVGDWYCGTDDCDDLIASLD